MLWLLLACAQSDLDSGEPHRCAHDCSLPACQEYSDCIEICSDGQDNDGDGETDCSDPECQGSASCVEDCSDGIDNDMDGVADCYDYDCNASPGCIEDCSDGVDNDMDGKTDCQDRDCRGHAPCLEDCSDGIDNDLDGLTDCEDSECAGLAPCIEDCSDALDNDLDGFTDCQDSDCAGVVAPCIEECSDGKDNDADGLVDCEDANCQLECTELDCTNGLDDNGNGQVDCEDAGCWGLAGCEPTFGIQLLRGSAQTKHFTSSTSYSDSALALHNEWSRLTIWQPKGTATIGLDESNVQCNWHAGHLSLANNVQRVQPASSSSFTSFQNILAIGTFESSGACAPYLKGQVSFNSHDRSSGGLAHSVVLGPPAYLDGTRWADGVLTSSYFGTYSSIHSFQIDPLLTEPWIFGP